MNSSRIRLMAALIAAIALGATTLHAAADAEHARLVSMCGTWDVEVTCWFQPGRPGITTKGTSTIRALFDGLFVEEKIEGLLNGTPFTTLAWTGFNTVTHQVSVNSVSRVRYRSDQVASPRPLSRVTDESVKRPRSRTGPASAMSTRTAIDKPHR